MVHETKILIILLLSYSFSSAQIHPGAKEIALSHSTVALANNVFSLFSNPSGLAQMNWREAGFYYSPSPFGLNELSNVYTAYHEPTGIGSFGVGFMTYGFELYKQNKFALSYANRLGDNIFIGISAQYHTLSINKYGNTSYLTIIIGSLIYINPDLRFGFSIDNLLRNSIGEEDSQVPIIYSTGISYDIFHNLTMNLALRKEIDIEAALSFGMDYRMINYLSLRFGFQNQPSTFSAGIGINYLKFELDYAAFNHLDLGLTHQVGLIIHFGDDLPRSERIKSSINSY